MYLQYKIKLNMVIMKKLILLIFAFTLFSCMGVKKETYTLEIKMLDGSIKTEKWILPKGSRLFITTYKGTYNLEYDSDYF